MSATLKLVQLNIEGSKHLDLALPFLKAQDADVICLQELVQEDAAFFAKELSMHNLFAPMMINHQGKIEGIGIFSKVPPQKQYVKKYGGNPREELVQADGTNKIASHNSRHFVLGTVELMHNGEAFRILTTHFPVTDKGIATDFQREDMKNLLVLLEQEGEFVLAGDFNAPRGGEIFAQLAEKYTDNIPPEITTSIDGALHRAGQLPHMVDGIFSTPGYCVSSVKGHTGLSDHWGFTAEINKVEI